ncbi:MAG: T9SS type A sorting domain-containing protein [Bacteroidales bacterium]|nr:T9SS type A sorting domain-containing protein [Bacteroidales bacterium]
MECYPVPADQTLTIKVNTTLSSFGIFDNYYHPVYQIDNIKMGTFTINTSSFRNGVYMIRAIDGEGNISTDKIIVNH